MASDSSDSPLVLTPESTGVPPDPTLLLPDSTASDSMSVPSSPSSHARRRQTAVYPNPPKTQNLNPFSKSAAKRESVMALGSIQHLQHYFTKTGLVSKKNPLNKPHHGLVPAIGGLQIPTSPLDDIVEREIVMPPSPAIPPAQSHAVLSPHVKTHAADPASLLPGVIKDVEAVARSWRLEQPLLDDDNRNQNLSDRPAHDENELFDVLTALRTTTCAIRSTRNYLLSLPDEEAEEIRVQFRPRFQSHPRSHSPSRPPTQVQSHTQGPSTLTRSRSSNSIAGDAAALNGIVSAPDAAPDPLVLIRRSALDVLTVLRALEEAARLPDADPESDVLSDTGSSPPRAQTHHRPHSVALARPSSSLSNPNSNFGSGGEQHAFALVPVQGRPPIPVWADSDDSDGFADEDDSGSAEALARRERWEALVSGGGGWLYRRDMRMHEVVKERKVVGKYLDLVDEVLFGAEGGAPDKSSGTHERAWERVKRKREGKEAKAKKRRVTMDVQKRGVSGGRASMGLSQVLRGLSLVEEPEEMSVVSEQEELATKAAVGRTATEEFERDAYAKWFAASGEELIDDEDLPDWAKRGMYEENDLGRAHALIAYFLPPHLLPYLASPTPTKATRAAFLAPPTTDNDPETKEHGSREAFLSSLSSGQLLCIAYNACLRKSKRPWGFVSREGIHDIIKLESAASSSMSSDADPTSGKEGKDAIAQRKVWTFRRTDNLRLWAGALKLRYMLPVQLPLPPSVAPLAGRALASVVSSSSKSVAAGSKTNSAVNTPAGTPLPSPTAVQRFQVPSALSKSLEANGSTAGGRARGDKEHALLFDARVIAARSEGWLDMLESVLLAWVEAAVNERRVFEA